MTSFVLGIVGIFWVLVVGPVLALVFGYIARGQIDRSGGAQEGRSLAITGIALGWAGLGFQVSLVAFVLVASEG